MVAEISLVTTGVVCCCWHSSQLSVSHSTIQKCICNAAVQMCELGIMSHRQQARPCHVASCSHDQHPWSPTIGVALSVLHLFRSHKYRQCYCLPNLALLQMQCGLWHSSRAVLAGNGRPKGRISCSSSLQLGCFLGGSLPKVQACLLLLCVALMQSGKLKIDCMRIGQQCRHSVLPGMLHCVCQLVSCSDCMTEHTVPLLGAPTASGQA